MKLAVFTLCVLALSACQTASNIGSGPITLSTSVQDLLRQYMKEDTPEVFAISTDGRTSSYRYCPDFADTCWAENSRWKAIQDCEGLSGGVPCKIYAVGRDIVWE